MRELGEILHLAKSGRLILRLTDKIAQNQTGRLITDENGRRVGKIIEIFGPVRSPYASVAPLIGKSNRLVGLKVFLYDEQPSRKKKSSTYYVQQTHYKRRDQTNH